MDLKSRTETISVIVPTRNRPEWLRRLWQSAKDTASVMPEFCTYIDDDDVLSVPVCEELGIKYRQGPKKVYTQNYNEAVEVATGSIMFDVADDFILREKDWDLKVISEFDKVDDKLILVHGFDGTEGAENATHFFVHRRWVETLGYLFPPYFRWANADVWMTRVAKMIGRQVYLPITLAEHMHLCQGKAVVDSTYSEASDRIRKYAWADIAGYHSLEDRRSDIEADAQKLREAIEYYAKNHRHDDHTSSNRSTAAVCEEKGMDSSSSRGQEDSYKLESTGGSVPKPLRPRFTRQRTI